MKLLKTFALLAALLTLQISNAGGMKCKGPLDPAIRSGDLEKCDALLKNGANVNAKNLYGTTALMESIIASDKKCFFRILEDKKVNVNLSDGAGWTALHHAADYGDGKMCDALLKQKANVNAKNKSGETPLAKSISVNKKKSFYRILEEENVDVNLSDKHGDSALHLAVKIRHEDKNMCLALLQNCANVNAKNKRDETPLIAAIRKNKIEIIKILLKNRAAEDIKCKNKTALQIAKKEKNVAAIEIFEWIQKTKFLFRISKSLKRRFKKDSKFCARKIQI